MIIDRTYILINLLSILIIGAGIFLLFRMYRQDKQDHKKQARQKEVQGKLVIALTGLSQLWIKDGTRKLPIHVETDAEGKVKIKLEELAENTWRPPEVFEEEEVEEYVEFNLKNERAIRFYDDHCKQIKGRNLTVIKQLLQLLDAEGHVSSVVSQQQTGDVEAGWDASTYEKLGKITLLDHSLNVADRIIELLRDRGSKFMIPDGIIAALGHDIGKLPGKRISAYAMGDHPITSAAVLSTFPAFLKLGNKDAIVEAVKSHHGKIAGDNLIWQELCTADRSARQDEIEQINLLMAEELDRRAQEAATPAVPAVPEATPVAPAVSEAAPVAPAAAPVTPAVPEAAPVAPEAIADLVDNIKPPDPEKVRNMQRDLYGDEQQSEEKKKGPRIKPIALGEWFNPERCLADIKAHINVMDGKTFEAFSMPDGTVYVQPPLLAQSIQTMAADAGATEIALLDRKNNKVMQPVLLAGVDALRGLGHIDQGKVQEGYFGGRFVVKHKKEDRIIFATAFYIPFKAEAFLAEGETLGELEDKKTGIIKNFGAVEVKK